MGWGIKTEGREGRGNCYARQARSFFFKQHNFFKHLFILLI